MQKSAENVNTADAAGVEDDESREVADLGRPKKVSSKTATDAEPRKTQGPDREISELWDPKGADPPGVKDDNAGRVVLMTLRGVGSMGVGAKGDGACSDPWPLYRSANHSPV